MASTSTQLVPSTSSFSSVHRQKYEVFLSFRGADTRFGFTDHLYAALKKIGILVFRDDEELERGEEIHPGLKDAIEASRYAVVVISEKFAESKSCLFELTTIMESKQNGYLTVFPIFYHVDPCDVRNQTGAFGEHFAQLRKDSKVDKVKWEDWKTILNQVGNCSVDPLESSRGALQNVSNLSGWHVKDRCESKIVEEISLKIFGGLIQNMKGFDKSLVGIESSTKEIMDLLSLELGGVRFVGICGMGGIGKTTLAEFIYQRISIEFEASCFIYRIGESKDDCLTRFQKQLISAILTKEVAESLTTDHDIIEVLKNRLSTKKVLIVLDDVNHNEQVEALAGSNDWFGEGSRIILTSRNHHFPPNLHKDNIYEVEPLNYNASLKLFCSKAFSKCNPDEKLMGLIKEIIDFAKGLPLALEVFGSYLNNADDGVWESYLAKIKKNLDMDVLKKLEITFHGLSYLAQEAFLDIACFYNGWCRDVVISKLNSLGYSSISILEDLQCKSLIKFSEFEKLFMHDLLAKMGKEIAKSSRLWQAEDIIPILRREIEIVGVKGITLQLPLLEKEKLSFEAFSTMKDLRMLRIFTKDDQYDLPRPLYMDLKVEWCGEPSKFKLGNELCVMEWWGYPLESLITCSNFEPINLVELKLTQSHLVRLWDGQKRLLKLKHIDLRYSEKLIELPDLSQVSNLEILDLSFCKSLSSVHSSIGYLKKLKQLLLWGCCSLEELSDKISSELFEYLDFWDAVIEISYY